MLGGSAGVSVPLHCTPSSFLIEVAGAETFLKSRPLPLSGFVTVSVVFAGTAARFAAVAEQCDEPVFWANVVGLQLCVSVTAPCRLSNATGIVTELKPFVFGSSVMRPKYWP